MAEKVNLAKYKAIQKKLETAHKKVLKIREVADDKVQHLVRTTEVAAGAFAFGLAHGYANGSNSPKDPTTGEPTSMADNISGVPTALIGAAVLHGLGLFGIGGNMASHLHSFGDGAMAAFASNFGRQIGSIKSSSPTGTPLGKILKSAMKSGDQTTLTAGDDSRLLGTNIAGQRLSDAELNALNKM
jgi:hypothetical protein